MAQSPLWDFSVKPAPEGVAVNFPHVPVVYHVPLLMIHPLALPPEGVTWRVPVPENGSPGVGAEEGEVVVTLVIVVPVVVEEPPPLVPLGSHFTPSAGQPDLEPSVRVKSVRKS